MIYTRTGAGITVDGIFYFVGMHVLSNDASDYVGLYGVITEIRTGDDRETENDTPDIYCQFDVPVLPCEVRQLEERFSSSPRRLRTYHWTWSSWPLTCWNRLSTLLPHSPHLRYGLS